MMMGKIEAQEILWLACRVKHKQVGGIRTVTVGGEFETYRDRAGRVRKRRVDGTGNKVFLPEHLLRRAGFEVFLPVKKVLRRQNRFGPKKVLVSQPLLADWVFVGWPLGENRWHDLMALDVVSGVMGTGGRPVIMSSSRMAKLMRKWGGGQLSPECHRFMKSGGEVSAGDVARVVAGPLDGVHVRVIDVTGPTAKAALRILGGESEIEIRSELLETVKQPDVKQ